MEKVKLYNFADFFLVSNNCGNDIIDGQKLTELPVEAGREKILDLLKQKKEELRIEQTRKFKEKYLEHLADETIKNSTAGDGASNQNIFTAILSKRVVKTETEDDHGKMILALLNEIKTAKLKH